MASVAAGFLYAMGGVHRVADQRDFLFKRADLADATRPQCRPARKSPATPNSRTSAKVAAPLDGFASKLQFVTMG
jgi:hypothetical protein